jgi:glycosyltransferase involved in cell wall biosynthesis
MKDINDRTACPTILCFVAAYLPGYRSGGPVRTIANFVHHLGDEFDIRIVTRDRDALDRKPYEGVVIDAWNVVSKAQVFYASERTITLGGVARLLRNTSHDVLYLNSFFAVGFTGLPLVARRLGLAPKTPCVIAPRGEFSAGAIALKSWKKQPYMRLARVARLYHGLHWQASSPMEAQHLTRELGTIAESIMVAPNLPPAAAASSPTNTGFRARDPGHLRVVFLSRISPMKNLEFLLGVVGRVSTPLELAIYGPVGDAGYWSRCQSLISALPENVAIEYRGEVMPAEVLDTFSASDVFVLPTRGENYGHVILESLIAGTPVLLSDRTPWQASGDNAVEVLPLENPDAWAVAIERRAQMDAQDLERMRLAARAYAQRYLDSSEAVAQNRALFIRAANAGTAKLASIADE